MLIQDMDQNAMRATTSMARSIAKPYNQRITSQRLPLETPASAVSRSR